MNKRKLYILLSFCLMFVIVLIFVFIKLDIFSRLRRLGGDVSNVGYYETYSPGDIIYFDPVSDSPCNENTFDISAINAGTSTCYKWRVIDPNDTTSDATVTVQLDHGLIVGNYENTSDVTLGPVALLSNLSTATNSWTKVPLLNYSYDTSLNGTNTGYNYGTLTCTNGTCKVGNTTIASGVRARVITVDELVELGKKVNATYDTKLVNWTIAAADYTDDYFSFSSTSRGNDTLKFMLENMIFSGDSPNDAGAVNSNSYTSTNGCSYWTLTPVSAKHRNFDGATAFVIANDGYTVRTIISNYDSTFAACSTGADTRPVIEYEKQNINVIFNDEERITAVPVVKGNTVSAISSQGKTGWTFSRWSLTKNGSAFDFTTPINQGITLYAVYTKDGCESSGEQTGVEFLEDLKANGATDLAYDDNADHNLRYFGSSANNYISFNDELWRIIGVFEVEDADGTKEKRVKIIRSDPLLTNVAYDTTPYADPAINGGMGINEWSQADLMKVLNPGYDTNSEETFTKVDSSTYTSNGNNLVNNSLYWNRANGLCLSGQYNQTVSCNFSSTGIKEEYKDYIDTVKWNTASIPSDTSSLSAYQLYDIERGNTTAKTESYSKNYSTGVDDEESRTTTWTGKIGLPYATDYIFSAGDHAAVAQSGMTRDVCLKNPNNYHSCTSSNTWFGNFPQFVLSPMSGYLNTGALMSVGMSQVIISANSVITRPALYLTTDTIIYEDTNGSGTAGSSTNPYKVKKMVKCTVTVTYNDENRITTREIDLGDTADEIASQGKPRSVFKYWSKNRTNAYDFTDPVNEDITLYAVYEGNTSQVELCESVSGTFNDKTFVIRIGGDITSSISLKHNECKTIELEAGTYTFTQDSTAYYTLQSVTGDITTNGGSLTAVRSNNYRITFNNNYLKKKYMHSFGRKINQILGGE